MKRRWAWWRFTLCGLGIVAAAPAWGNEGVTLFDSPVPVTLEADRLSFDRAASTYEAAGRVRLQKGGMTLVADRFWWNTGSGEAGAEGEISLAEGGGTLSGDAVLLNLDTNMVRLKNARAALPEQGFYLVGAEIEKVGDRSFKATDGTFTTCAGTPPDWKFGAESLQVDLGRYARARNVVFYLRDIPVFYFPYLLYPVKSERESGFLVPRAGYSRTRGSELSLAYYQVLARNQDATVYLDYHSSLGIGTGLEYRYLFGTTNEGTWRGYRVNGFGSARNSSALGWRHEGQLPGQVRLAADLEYADNRDYFADFGETAEEYNKDVTESLVILSRHWEKINLGSQFRYVQDLERSDRETLQRLPEAQLVAVRRRVGATPYYLRFDATADNFWRQKGEKGQRYLLRPALAAVWQPGDWLNLETEAGYGAYWFITPAEQVNAGVPDLSARLSTRVERVYASSTGDDRRLRHSVEPELRYDFVPNQDQSSLPVFEPDGVIEPSNRVSLGLVNRLTRRVENAEGTSDTLEVLVLRLSQQYDLHEARRERTPTQSHRNTWTPLRAELNLQPNHHSFLELDARYAFSGGRPGLDQVGARGGLHDGRGNELSLDYLYQRDAFGYVAGHLATALLKPVYLRYSNRLDTQRGKSLEHVFDLEYRSQCWSLFFTVRDRLEDREYMVSFGLSGLGRSAGFGGGNQPVAD